MTVVRLSRRPMPNIPDGYADWFEPDQAGLGEWVRETFINDDGALYNQRHQHLAEATIGWLWTNAEAANRDRMIAGESRLVAPPSRKWSSGMAQHQLRQWFGFAPDFVIIISAPFSLTADDWSFCALLEHELSHCGQDVDPFGAPRFSRDGTPMFRLLSHDVEEFVDVVERYGADATNTRAMVQAANAGPTIGAARIAAACGTCSSGRRTG